MKAPRSQPESSAARVAALEAQVEQLRERLAFERANHQASQEMVIEAQRQLELSRDLYTNLYDHAPVGYLLLDPDGFIRKANLTLAAMLGVPRPRLANSLLSHYVATDDRRKLLTHLYRCRQGAMADGLDVTSELKVNGAEGRVLDVLLTSRPEPAAAKPRARLGFHTVLTDVTERKQAEQSRAELAAIVESSVDAISAIDLDGVITAWAPGAERLYGYSASEALGKSISLIVPPDRGNEIASIIEKLKQGERIVGFETERVRKNGERIEVSLTISPLRNAKGQIVGSSGISRDNTERKRLERQLLEAGEREQQRIGHDLHDGLGQELHGLYYLARLLERDLKKELPARAPEAKRLARVLREAFRVTRGLVHGLRPVTPVPEGLMLTLRGLARRTRDLYGLDCRFDCRQPVLIHHPGAATHLYRIAQEAVNNAIKHAHPTRVRIELAATSQGIILGVRDNGVGIGRRNHPFGGMGLHIMQFRAEAIRGTLIVQRQPKGGTEVVCRVADEALAAPGGEPK